MPADGSWEWVLSHVCGPGQVTQPLGKLSGQKVGWGVCARPAPCAHPPSWGLLPIRAVAACCPCSACRREAALLDILNAGEQLEERIRQHQAIIDEDMLQVGLGGGLVWWKWGHAAISDEDMLQVGPGGARNMLVVGACCGWGWG